MPTLFMTLLAATVPNPPPQAPPGLEDFGSQLIAWLKWGGLLAGMAGLIICGIMMSIGRRNRSMTAVDGAAGVPWVFGGLTIISFSAAVVGQLLK